MQIVCSLLPILLYSVEFSVALANAIRFDAVGPPSALHITRVITETVFILSITLLLFGKRLKPYTMPCIFAAYALEEM